MNTTIKTIDAEGNPLHIKIRCNDQCKNGHDTFSITGSLYTKGKPLADKYYKSGGCIHDTILSSRPDLKPFVNLHLSDGDGVPMYAIEKGFFYYSAKYPPGKWFETLRNHLRITDEECEKLVSDLDNTKHKKELFTVYVKSQMPRWKNEADQAKQLLQSIISEQPHATH